MFPSEVQRAICRRLNATDYFATAPAIVAIPRCRGDFLAEAQASIQRVGIVILVLPGDGKFFRSETPVPAIKGTWKVRVEENAAVNRSAGGSRQPAEDVAWAAVQRLLHWIPEGDSGAPLAGSSFIPGEINHSEATDKSGNVWFASEFTVHVDGGDSEGVYGAALRRAQ